MLREPRQAPVHVLEGGTTAARPPVDPTTLAPAERTPAASGPDGGVARLRLYGVLCPSWKKMEIREPIDMAAIVHGGRPIACNNEHFGKLSNLIAPPPGQNMGDGWETRRRRTPGHDWAVLALGAPTLVNHIIVDTAYFKGNYPDRCSLQAALNPDLATDDIDGLSQHWDTILGRFILRRGFGRLRRWRWGC